MPTLTARNLDVYYEQTTRDATTLETFPYTFVFVHGMGGAVETWTGIRAYLLKYNCIYVDLPGHGRSSGEPLTVQENSDVVVELLRCVVPNERCVFVGISYGSAVAMQIAVHYPDLTAGLVLVSPRAHFNVSSDTLEELTSAVADGSFVRRGAGTKTSLTMIQGMERGMARTAPATISGLFKKYNGFDIRRELGDIKVPTVVLSGLEDGISDKDDARLIHKAVESSRLIELPTGHFIPIEAPRSVVSALKGLIAQISESL